MSTDLDDRLRGLFTELAKATLFQTPLRFQPEQVPYAGVALDRPHRAKRLVLAGIAAAAILIIAVIMRRIPDDSPKVSTSPIPSTDSVLWVPRLSSGALNITAYTEADAAPINQGAVRAPGGTLFGLTLNADIGDAVTGGGDERQIAGHTVRTSTQASAPDWVFRTMSLGCSNLGVTTAGEEPWSSDAIALLEGVALVEGSVRLDLPSGWTSLGEARSSQQFGISFDYTVGATTHALNMWQMPNAPAGFYLSNTYSAPHPVYLGGQQGWIFGGGESGFTSLVSERDGTAFVITGDGNVSGGLLILVAEALVRAPQADWTAHDDPNMSNITAAPAPAGCHVPSLEILSNP